MAKKASTQSTLFKEVNFHLAVIAIALVSAFAAGMIFVSAQEYRSALASYDTAVLGAMTE